MIKTEKEQIVFDCSKREYDIRWIGWGISMFLLGLVGGVWIF